VNSGLPGPVTGHPQGSSIFKHSEMPILGSIESRSQFCTATIKKLHTNWLNFRIVLLFKNLDRKLCVFYSVNINYENKFSSRCKAVTDNYRCKFLFDVMLKHRINFSVWFADC
jgi:hypothetical protein